MNEEHNTTTTPVANSRRGLYPHEVDAGSPWFPLQDAFWHGLMPWRANLLGCGDAGDPRDYRTGQRFRGINVLMLAWEAYSCDYRSPFWVPDALAREHGSAAFGVPVMQFDRTGRLQRETIAVVNADAVPGLPPCRHQLACPADPIAECKRILGRHPHLQCVDADQDARGYVEDEDRYEVDKLDWGLNDRGYFIGLMEGLVRATAHPSRLGSPRPTTDRERLIWDLAAEIGSGLLCGRANLRPPLAIACHLRLMGEWDQTLRKDPGLLLPAGLLAQRAVDYVLGEPTPEPERRAVERVLTGKEL